MPLVAEADPLFLVGAGFGVDAREWVGVIRAQSLYGEYEIECGYPLVSNLPDICFPGTDVRPDQVEARLADAITEREFGPLKNLCFELQKADGYLATRRLR